MNLWKWVSELDWGGFVPDLIVGLATGVAVGFVLVWFERRLVDQRRRVDDARWFGRLERVEGALTAPLPFTPASYRPDGDIIEHIERLCDGVGTIHPRVAEELPELAFIHPLLENLDALRLVADRLERATDAMLAQPLFTTEAGKKVIDSAEEHTATVRELVRSVSPDEPWAQIVPGAPWLSDLRNRMASNVDFAQEASHYRTILRQVDAFRTGFLNYRSALRWEGHKRTLERIKSPNWKQPSAREIERENQALKKLMEPVLAREMEQAYSTVPGC